MVFPLARRALPACSGCEGIRIVSGRLAGWLAGWGAGIGPGEKVWTERGHARGRYMYLHVRVHVGTCSITYFSTCRSAKWSVEATLARGC